MTTRKEPDMRPTQKAAIALIAGATIHAAGGVIGQVVRASTTVSDDLLRYPWTRDGFLVLCLCEAVAFSLGVVGFAGLRASGVAGPTRAARVGLGLAAAGSTLFVVAELALIPVRDQSWDDGAAGTLGALAGLATLLLSAGLVAAGVAARRARRWEGWRPTSLLACGVWTLGMLGIAWTAVLPLGVTVLGLLQLAVGVGLLTRPLPAPADTEAALTPAAIALR